MHAWRSSGEETRILSSARKSVSAFIAFNSPATCSMDSPEAICASKNPLMFSANGLLGGSNAPASSPSSGIGLGAIMTYLTPVFSSAA